MGMGANSFSTENTVNGTVGWDFGFRTKKLLICNDKASAIFVSLDSTVASTDGHRTCAGEQIEFLDSQVELLGLYGGTATSTATFVRVSAWGW